MSHKDEQVICPNCGFHTSENYCARCGQETHLHSETFLGLIMHFIGHYFHYDSKFWKTIAALWMSPGKLTRAYWDKQRMRYIPPISLYIFISVVFFIVYTSLPSRSSKEIVKMTANSGETGGVGISTEERQLIHSFRKNLDEVDNIKGADSVVQDSIDKAQKVKLAAMTSKMEEDKGEIKDRALHMLPKVFFFLIPVMGLVLLLLFNKRKDLTYVSHTIFALHYHTFWFSVMLFEQLYRFPKGRNAALYTAILISVVYFVIALKKAYDVSWLRSVGYSIVTAIVYVLALAIALLAIVMIIMIPYLKYF